MPKIDLASLDSKSKAESGAPVDILHPVSGEPLGLTIVLAGADSATYRRSQAAMLRRQVGRRTQNDAEGTRANACRLLGACTLSWVWCGASLDGGEPDCTPEAATELYARFPWIYEQVDQAVHDRAAYLQD